MNILRAALQRALRRLLRYSVTLSLASRLSLAFAVMVTLFAPAAVLPSPVRAAEPPGPVTRLQVVVKSIEIVDDREGSLSGAGEMDFSARGWLCNEAGFPQCEIDNGHVKHGTMMASIDRRINAYRGDTVPL